MSDLPTESHVEAPRWRCCPFEGLSVLELQRLHIARQAVFVIEQVCVYQDADANDERCQHLAAWSAQQQVLAYARLVPPGVIYREASIGRVLTTAAARGTGLGRELVQRAVTLAVEAWPGAGLRISAQLRLAPFYASYGFEAVGEPYLEDGQPHLEMHRPG
jgi:ElaA protein